MGGGDPLLSGEGHLKEKNLRTGSEVGAETARRPPHHSDVEGPHLPPHLSLILPGDPPPLGCSRSIKF